MLADFAAATRQPSGGPYLGLEPGLGLTTPLLDQHKRDKSAAAAAGDGSAPPTPSSMAASDAARQLEQQQQQPLQEQQQQQEVRAEVAGGHAEPEVAPKTGRRPQPANLLYGIINAIVGIPTMISFAAIAYNVSVTAGLTHIGLPPASGGWAGPAASGVASHRGMHHSQCSETKGSTVPLTRAGYIIGSWFVQACFCCLSDMQTM